MQKILLVGACADISTPVQPMYLPDLYTLGKHCMHYVLHIVTHGSVLGELVPDPVLDARTCTATLTQLAIKCATEE